MNRDLRRFDRRKIRNFETTYFCKSVGTIYIPGKDFRLHCLLLQSLLKRDICLLIFSNYPTANEHQRLLFLSH